MPYELLLTTRQTTEIRNAFTSNISTDIKLRKAQITKIVQSGGSFGSWLGHSGKKALTNFAIYLARDNLPGLVSNLASNIINKFERKKVENKLWEQGKNLLYLFRMKIRMILLKS